MNRFYIFLFICLTTLTLSDCTKLNSQSDVKSIQLNEELPWSIQMTESVIKRQPEAWQIDLRNRPNRPRWAYTNGLVLMSIQKVAKKTGNTEYSNYVKGYADKLISDEGEILRYKIKDFNIDNINPGKILFDLYKDTKDPKYRTAIETLRNQLRWQPRNSQGGFWHKLRYPWQMWLDGLYMGSPFYAQYTKEFGEIGEFDDIIKQFILIEKNTRDATTGLLYHGWDESTLQRWANDETGTSPHFWGRAIGWYMMALVDVLDFLPQNHASRQDIIDILERTSDAMIKAQDKETGLWYQILNLPKREGNYLEATISSMASYAMLKGTRKGYLNPKYKQAAVKAYEGVIEHFIKVDESGEVFLTQCNAVAGLGGDPYRDGSFEYYISEDIIDNDPKGVGPFILASLEYEMLRD